MLVFAGGLTYEQVQAMCPPGIVVAVHNDVRTCTVVGPEKQVPQFVKSLLSKGIVAKMIKNSAPVAFHSPHIAKEAEILAEKIKEVNKQCILFLD
jgi:acyl transferase domain-containing protein